MKKNKIILILALAFIIRVIFSFLVWHGDVYNHMDWGKRFFEYGAVKYYAPETNIWSFLWPNQPPGTIYMFAGVYKLFKFIFSFFWWININVPLFPSGIITYFDSNLYPALLKLPAILADFGIAYLIYIIISNLHIPNSNNRKKYAVLGAILFLFNPISWYISSVWGQYDSVIFFLTFLSFYFLLQKRPTLATVFFALSIYTKLTLIVFAPIFLIIYIKQKYPLSAYIKSIIIPIVLIGILTFPFSRSEPYGWLFYLYKDKVLVEQRQVLTSNAFNIWAGLTGIHLIADDKLLGPLSYKAWGLIFFGFSYLFPLYLVFKRRDSGSLLWVLAIISISAFSLLTNMHERYLFAFFPIATILMFIEKRLILFYVLITVINLLNLYNFWWTPEIFFIKNMLSVNGGYFGRILGYFEFGLYLYFYWFFIRKFRIGEVKILK